jgi:hypothetical protein
MEVSCKFIIRFLVPDKGTWEHCNRFDAAVWAFAVASAPSAPGDHSNDQMALQFLACNEAIT